MDIWKEAPEDAEYYDKGSNLFYRVIGMELHFYANADKWSKSTMSLSVLNGLLKRNAVIKRPQAEQEAYETEAAKADRELGKELKVYPEAEERAVWKDGLPPVGYTQLQIEKPIGWNDGDFKVVAHVEGIIDEDGQEYEIAILCSKNGAVKPFLADELKPVKSQAEKEREEAINSMIAACPYSGTKSTKIDCEALYDAGYRLDAKGDV